MPFPPFDEYDEFGNPRFKMPLFAPQSAAFNPANYSPIPIPVQQPNQNPIQQTGQSFSQVSPTMLQGALSRTPNFDPRPVTPRALTPAEQESYPVPRREDYAPTRLRTILNAIVAGGVGTKDPKFGFQLGSELSDRPYNQAIERYQAQTADQKRRIGIEAAARTDAEQAAERGIKAGTAQENEVYKDATLGIRGGELGVKKEAQDTRAKEQASKDKYRQELAKHRTWQESHPGGNPIERILEMPPGDDRDAAMEVYKDLNPSKVKTDEQIKSAAAARAEGTAIGNLTPAGQQAASILPSIRTTATTRAGILTRENTITPEDQAALDSQVQRSIADPDNIQNIEKGVDKRLKSRYWSALAKSNAAIPRTLTPKAQETATSAKTAINHANSIRELIKDPDMQKAMGPIAGRLTEGGNVIGKSVYNSGPAAAKEAELLGMLRYLVTFEASSTSGTRPSWQLIQYLKGTSPGARMDLDKFNGALDAVIMSAGNRLSGIYGASSSGKDIAAPAPSKGWSIRKKQ